MKKLPKISYLVFVFFIVLAMKFAYKYLDTQDLNFILKPVDTLVSLILNSESEYTIDLGYVHKKNQFYIDKSCSGFNFMLISFSLLSYLFIQHIQKNTKILYSIFFSLILSYLLTIPANVSRIVFAVFFQHHLKGMFPSSFGAQIHEALGIINYLIILYLIYIATLYLFTRRDKIFNFDKIEL